MQPSQVDFKTFNTVMEMVGFLNNHNQEWEWWQIVVVPDYVDLMLSMEVKYRVFFIVKP